MLVDTMKKIAVLNCLFICILLPACSSFTSPSDLKAVTKLFALQPVPASLQNKVWLEKFTFSLTNTNGQVTNKLSNDVVNESILLQTELTKESINIAAMTFAGIPLAQAKWQSDSRQVISEMTSAKHFDAAQVLHDLQSVNWPLALLRPVLGDGFSVSEEIIAGIRTRHFYHDQQVIIIVCYQALEQGLSISFEQKSAGYHLAITRLSDTVIPSKHSYPH